MFLLKPGYYKVVLRGNWNGVLEVGEPQDTAEGSRSFLAKIWVCLHMMEVGRQEDPSVEDLTTLEVVGPATKEEFMAF